MTPDETSPSAPQTTTPRHAAGTASARSVARDTALDGLRFIAVLLMMASHTTRLIVWDERREWSRFSLLIEPLTASLFLILVGASLVHSWRSARVHGRAAWFRKQSIRAAALWAVSCVFYALEDGLQLPDVLTMSGILATIAYTGLLGMLLVAGPRPIPALLAVVALCLGTHLWLDHHGLQVFVLNAGNSPLLPLFPFACLGALGALSLERGAAVRFSILAAAVAALAFILHRHGFAAVFSKPLGRYETIRTLSISHGGVRTRVDVPYYNLRPILVPVIASLVVLIYAALAVARSGLDKAQRWLLPMGRRSLDVYILHLTVLAGFVVVGGKRPLKLTWQGDAVMLGLIPICWGWVLMRDRIAAKRFRDRNPAGDREEAAVVT